MRSWGLHKLLNIRQKNYDLSIIINKGIHGIKVKKTLLVSQIVTY